MRQISTISSSVGKAVKKETAACFCKQDSGFFPA
jgi:hypothetical protein